MNYNSYYVIQERNKDNKKMIAYAEKVPNSYNLLSFFHPCKDFEIISINACKTLKEAKEIANFWNKCARESGNYYF